jgi:hypothetical protein
MTDKEVTEYIITKCKELVKREGNPREDISTFINDEWKLIMRGQKYYSDVVLDLIKEEYESCYQYRLIVSYTDMRSDVYQTFGDYHMSQSSTFSDGMDWFSFAGETVGMDELQIAFDELLIALF